MFFKKRKWQNPAGRAEDDQKEFIAISDLLFETGPHTPKHAKPELDSIGDGLALACGLEGTKWIFVYFEDYPENINRLSDSGAANDIGPWRLEQVSDPFSPINSSNGPVVAVSYVLFYNSLDVGRVVLQPRDSGFSKNPEISLGVFLDVSIQFAPIIPAQHILGILSAVAEGLSFDEDGICDPKQSQAILGAMCRTQWESSRTSSKFTELHFTYRGHVLTQAKL